MVITELVWTEDRVAHIAKHGVEPPEVEDVCFSSPLVLRSKAEGPNPVYYVFGQTDSGRHLFCVIILFPNRRGYPVTARDMTAAERKRFSGWKKL